MEFTSKKDAEKQLKAARKELKAASDILRKASQAVIDAKTPEAKDKAIKHRDELQLKKNKAVAKCANIQLVIDRL